MVGHRNVEWQHLTTALVSLIFLNVKVDHTLWIERRVANSRVNGWSCKIIIQFTYRQIIEIKKNVIITWREIAENDLDARHAGRIDHFDLVETTGSPTQSANIRAAGGHRSGTCFRFHCRRRQINYLRLQLSNGRVLRYKKMQLADERRIF